MARIYQVPSHARGWLTLAIIATSLPQLVDGPWWQSPLLLLVLGWRALVDRQRLLLPGRVVRELAVLLHADGHDSIEAARGTIPDADAAIRHALHLAQTA